MTSIEKLKYKYAMLDVSGKLITWIVAISLFAWLLQYLYVPAFEQLALPGLAFEAVLQPWSFITYGFLHSGIFHLLFNMLVLNIVGRGILNVLGSKPFLGLFFMGVIAGGIGFCMATLIAPAFFNAGYMVGASAGVYALLFFLCFYLPDTQVRLIIWNVKLIYIAYVLLGVAVFSIFGRINPGGNVAHVMGAGVGYFGAIKMHNGIDITSGFQNVIEFFKNLLDGKVLKKKAPLKTVYKNKERKLSSRVMQKSSQQEQIDAVLDKISQSGYESLSTSEKEVLFKAGKD